MEDIQPVQSRFHLLQVPQQQTCDQVLYHDARDTLEATFHDIFGN